MDRGLRALYRRISRQYRPVQVRNAASMSSLSFYYDEYPGAQTRRVKAEEKPQFEQFMRTGVPDNLGIYLTQEGLVEVIGERVQESRVLCTIGKTSITANAVRSNHIMKLLEQLADREKLKLNIVQQTLDVTEGIAIAFWAFKKKEEVDDKDLVSKAKPRVRAIPVVDEEMSEQQRVNQQMRDYALQYINVPRRGTITQTWDNFPF